MDKRTKENIRVKNAITDAFFQLLRIELLESISVTQIVNYSGVSRMAYYRNFNTKLDIIDYFMESGFHALLSEHNSNLHLWSLEYGHAFLKYMQDNKDTFLLLVDRGYSGFILNAFNRANEELAGDMPFNSIQRFKLYCAAGASFNAVILWLQDGCKESICDINNIIFQFMLSGVYNDKNVQK